MSGKANAAPARPSLTVAHSDSVRCTSSPEGCSFMHLIGVTSESHMGGAPAGRSRRGRGVVAQEHPNAKHTCNGLHVVGKVLRRQKVHEPDPGNVEWGCQGAASVLRVCLQQWQPNVLVAPQGRGDGGTRVQPGRPQRMAEIGARAAVANAPLPWDAPGPNVHLAEEPDELSNGAWAEPVVQLDAGRCGDFRT
eukprot:scaffold2631_cov412-Prasinococcus_capsulatus_cf.AAC.17